MRLYRAFNSYRETAVTSETIRKWIAPICAIGAIVFTVGFDKAYSAGERERIESKVNGNTETLQGIVSLQSDDHDILIEMRNDIKWLKKEAQKKK